MGKECKFRWERCSSDAWSNGISDGEKVINEGVDVSSIPEKSLTIFEGSLVEPPVISNFFTIGGKETTQLKIEVQKSIFQH